MNTPPNESKPSRIIVKFKDVAKNLNDNPTQVPASIQILNKKFHVQEISKLLKTTAPNMNVSLFEHVYLLELDSNVDVSQAVMEYSQDPHVVYAQPDYIAHTQS